MNLNCELKNKQNLAEKSKVTRQRERYSREKEQYIQNLRGKTKDVVRELKQVWHAGPQCKDSGTEKEERPYHKESS